MQAEDLRRGVVFGLEVCVLVHVREVRAHLEGAQVRLGLVIWVLDLILLAQRTVSFELINHLLDLLVVGKV